MEETGQKILFTEGMNLDDDPRFLKQGEHREAYNLRFSGTKNGNAGAREMLPSTVANTFTLPAQNSICIGSYTYEPNNCCYDFYWNSEGFHFITEHNYITGDTVKLIEDITDTASQPVLNFTLKKILHAKVIPISGTSGTEYLLLWANSDNPPRKLNITKAKSGFYSVYTENIISLSKQPFLGSVPAKFENDYTRNTNYLRGKPLPQFFIQWVYDDNELSVYSPISSIFYEDGLPFRDEYFGKAGANANLSVSNRIKLDVPMGPEEVKSVRIGFRESNTGNFYIAGEIKKSSVGQCVYGVNIYAFLLNANSEAIATTFGLTFNGTDFYSTSIADVENKSYTEIYEELKTYFESEPALSTYTFEVITDKQVNPYLQITSNVNFDLEPSPVDYLSVTNLEKLTADDNSNSTFYFYNDGAYSLISNSDGLQPYDNIPFTCEGLDVTDNNVVILSYGTVGWQNVNVECNLTISDVPRQIQKVSNDTLRITGTSGAYIVSFEGEILAGTTIFLNYRSAGVPYTFSYKYLYDTGNATTARDIFARALYIAIRDKTIDMSLGAAGSVGPIRTIVFSGLDDQPAPTIEGVLDLKTLRSPKRGGAYQYGIVYRDANKRESPVNTNDTCKITVPFFNIENQNTLPQVSWAISHIPPERATSYFWVRSKNVLFDYFIQFFAGYSYLKDGERFIDLNNLTYFQSNNQATEAYTFEQGDRIRFISYPGALADVSANNNDTYIKESPITIGTYYPIAFPREISDPSRSLFGSRYTVQKDGEYTFNYNAIDTQFTYNGSTAVAVSISLYFTRIRNGVTTRTLKTFFTHTLSANFTRLLIYNATDVVTDALVDDIYLYEYRVTVTGGSFDTGGISYLYSTFGELTVTDNSVTDDTLSPFPSYVDVEVKSQNGTILSIGDVPFLVAPGTFFEIYRPKKLIESNRLRYYEISQEFDIINPGTDTRYHGGQTQNQDANNPATGLFNGGEIWNKFSTIYQLGANQADVTGGSNTWSETPFYSNSSIVYYQDILFKSIQNSNQNHKPLNDNGTLNDAWWERVMPRDVLRESLSFSDYYETDDSSDIGRESLVLENSKQQTINGIWYSKPYVQDTFINGSSTFPLTQYKLYDNFYGPLLRIAYFQRQLRMLFYNITGQIFINEEIILSNRGDETVAKSNQFLSDIQYLAGNYGVGDFPESYQNSPFGEFFFDNIAGGLCYIEGNSVVDFSPMAKLFNFIQSQAIASKVAGSEVISGINLRDKEYLITFKPQGGTSVTLSVDMLRKKSGTFYSFIPDYYGRTTSLLRAFKQVSTNIAWTFSNEALANTFFGTYYPSSVVAVVNEMPTAKKIFEHFTINANSKWELSSIVIPADESYPTGMLSRVKKDNIGLYEGAYWGKFLRDINTPTLTMTEIERLFKGRKLRGDQMEITLQSDSTSIKVLFSLEVFFALSLQTS